MNYLGLDYRKHAEREVESLWPLAVAAVLLTLILFRMGLGRGHVAEPWGDAQPEIPSSVSARVLG